MGKKNKQTTPILLVDIGVFFFKLGTVRFDWLSVKSLYGIHIHKKEKWGGSPFNLIVQVSD